MKLALFTGDKRFDELAALLEKDGHRVFKNDINAIGRSEALILPLPINAATAAKGKLPYLPDILSADLCAKCVFAGVTDDFMKRAFESRGASFYDYMKNEALLQYNASLTVEGAISEAVSVSSGALHRSDCLITGYGRIARRLACVLKALGAEVTIALRRRELFGEIERSGYTACTLENVPLNDFDYIFNTIPAIIFNSDEISKIKPECVLMELASAPGGFDESAAKKTCKYIVKAGGLPGKYAYKAAAQAIHRVIADKLKEE